MLNNVSKILKGYQLYLLFNIIYIMKNHGQVNFLLYKYITDCLMPNTITALKDLLIDIGNVIQFRSNGIIGVLHQPLFKFLRGYGARNMIALNYITA